MQFVGIAHSDRRIVAVPNVLRGLARSLALAPDQHLPLPIDMLSIPLSADESDIGGFSRPVNNYHHCWWTASAPPELGKIMNIQSLSDCILVHQEALKMSGANVDSDADVPPPPSAAAAAAFANIINSDEDNGQDAAAAALEAIVNSDDDSAIPPSAAAAAAFSNLVDSESEDSDTAGAGAGPAAAAAFFNLVDSDSEGSEGAGADLAAAAAFFNLVDSEAEDEQSNGPSASAGATAAAAFFNLLDSDAEDGNMADYEGGGSDDSEASENEDVTQSTPHHPPVANPEMMVTPSGITLPRMPYTPYDFAYLPDIDFEVDYEGSE